MSVLLAMVLGCSCNDGPGDGKDPLTSSVPTVPPTSPPTGTPGGGVPFEPAPASLLRVTEAEWRNSAEDLFGVRFEGALPIDLYLYNYSRVGGSEITIPPLDLELYEAAAWSVAESAAGDTASAAALTGCAEDASTGCVRNWALGEARRAWRRPPETEELDELVDLYASVLEPYGATLATQALIAAILQSPDFLFHVAIGEPDPAHPEPGWRRYTSWEMAGRLASFVTATVPDEALADAADAGELLTTDGILAQADRLLATDRARAAMQDFFAETVDLQELDAVTKDTLLYPEFTDALKAEMALELRLLFADVALDREADLGELLTTNQTFVGPELGGIYGIPATGFTNTTLPAGSQRGGLLGRAGFLAIQSHNVTTSPTYRGKFVRTRLMCQDIPPPPPGVVTDLDPLAGGTLRDQLEQHATDPVCAACHDAMDPAGFALEHFDPIGRWRDLDNGLPIDATGDIDGVTFDGAEQLGQVVADNALFPSCMALELYRYANAQVERVPDLGMVDAIASDYVDAGERFKPLVRFIVSSDAFRLVTAPLGETCDAPGTTRACATACGGGTEVCANGRWQTCTAPAPAPEACNNLDDDCDGAIDEGPERVCDSTFGPGTEVCDAGVWQGCDGGPPPGPTEEVCNGVDDDQDGATDEDMQVAVTHTTYTDLTNLGHYACDAHVDPYSPACHAATSRFCAQAGCGAVTGVGPVWLGATDLDLACFDASEATVIGSSFSELSGYHYGCNQSDRQGGPCNAAINRMCQGRGLTTGFGPVENYGDAATIVCTPNATVLNGYYTILSGYDPGCNQSVRWGSSCNHAIHEWCRAQGFETGHGPLENSGDLAVVACMGVL